MHELIFMASVAQNTTLAKSVTATAARSVSANPTARQLTRERVTKVANFGLILVKLADSGQLNSALVS